MIQQQIQVVEKEKEVKEENKTIATLGWREKRQQNINKKKVIEIIKLLWSVKHNAWKDN